MKSIFLILLLTTISFSSEIKFVKYNKNSISQTQALTKVDNYFFSYSSKDKECTLYKNSKLIPSFDPKFKHKKPKVQAYKCTAWIKEHYSKCNILKTKSVSSVATAYGKFDRTNLLIGYNPDYYKADAYLEMQCQ